MSATTEILLNQIRELETQLLEARGENDPQRVTTLENRLQEMQKRLSRANETLTESRSVLKG
jgi:DNA-binding protein H-NS